jgi:predicted RNA-binding protein with PUA-like domain
MAHWLYKSEPSSWSWARQLEAGAAGTHWNGVRNHLAKQNLLAMRLGDQGFFYHSNEERQIVGIVEVIKTAYPDPSDETGRFVMVDVRALKAVPKPVTLAAIKAEPELADLSLVRQSRLSVMAIDDASAQILLKMGGVLK